MKKALTLILALATAFAFTACKDKDIEIIGGDDGPTSVIVGESNVGNKPSSSKESPDDCFIWGSLYEDQIDGLTDKGMKQTELVIPARCTKVLSLNDENDNPAVNLKKVTFASPDTALCSTFSDCTALEEVELPANLKDLDGNVFTGCTSLKQIIIPDGVTRIDSNSFRDCTALEEIVIPNGVETIDRQTFESCTSLKKVVLGDNVKLIDKSAFEHCEALAEINFPVGLETIEKSAFYKCDSLKSVKLPEGVKTLGAKAFFDCNSMEEIYLPASLESMVNDSVAQIHKTKIYVVEGSYADLNLEGQKSAADFLEKCYQ